MMATVKGDSDGILLDDTPSGIAEEEQLFEREVIDQADLNDIILHERRQDMAERKLFADRAYFITKVWIWFLVGLSATQIAVSFWHVGLTNAQFVTVVTTTTTSVLGFWFLVGKYLHQTRRAEEPRKKHKRIEVQKADKRSGA